MITPPAPIVPYFATDAKPERTAIRLIWETSRKVGKPDTISPSTSKVAGIGFLVPCCLKKTVVEPSVLSVDNILKPGILPRNKFPNEDAPLPNSDSSRIFKEMPDVSLS